MYKQDQDGRAKRRRRRQAAVGGGSWPGAIGGTGVPERLPAHCTISPSNPERTKKPFAEGAMAGLSLAVPMGMAAAINSQQQ